VDRVTVCASPTGIPAAPEIAARTAFDSAGAGVVMFGWVPYAGTAWIVTR
jgi:hypothetical protein